LSDGSLPDGRLWAIENPRFRFSLCRGVSRRSLKLRENVTGDKLHFISAGDDGGEGRDNYRQQGEPADPTRAYAALLSAITSHFTKLHLLGVLGFKTGELMLRRPRLRTAPLRGSTGYPAASQLAVLCFAHGVNHLGSIVDAGGCVRSCELTLSSHGS
jgi:hypothetical protein